MQRRLRTWHSPYNKTAHVQSPTSDQRFTLKSMDLTCCMLINFYALCRLLIFSKSSVSNTFRNTIEVSNRFDPDQARPLSADDTSKQRFF